MYKRQTISKAVASRVTLNKVTLNKADSRAIHSKAMLSKVIHSKAIRSKAIHSKAILSRVIPDISTMPHNHLVTSKAPLIKPQRRQLTTPALKSRRKTLARHVVTGKLMVAARATHAIAISAVANR